MAHQLIVSKKRCPVPKKHMIATLAAFSLALGMAAAPAQAQYGPGYARPGYRPQYYVGSIYHPNYGYLVYYYFPSTGFAYFPALRSGVYVSGGGAGVPYQPNVGSPADRWLDQSEGRGRYGGLGHLGPYATIRRANEVASYYRSLGYNTSAPYHNGNGHYVDVR
jgi:hypothetical protein